MIQIHSRKKEFGNDSHLNFNREKQTLTLQSLNVDSNRCIIEIVYEIDSFYQIVPNCK
jgi:hypothetical protein